MRRGVLFARPKEHREALDAFRSAHDEIPRYDHGDCQSFADEIVYRLTGNRTGFGGGGFDFM